MEPNRKTDRILGEWHAVSASARRPTEAPRAGRPHGAWSALGLAGAGLLAAGLVVAVAAFGGRTTGVAGTSPSPASSELAVAPSAAATPSATTSPSPSHAAATPSPTPKRVETPPPTPTPMFPCAPSELSARIVSWEGAAGSRIATVDLQASGPNACVVATQMRLRLVDGANRVLADSGSAHGASDLTVQPGEKLSTMVEVSNVCGAPPVPPVTLEFEVQPGHWLRAAPVSPTDATVPPCNGPSQPAAIQMHDWAKA